MALLKTFDYPSRYGASGEFEPKVRETPFGDGYKQTTGDGINSENESWPLTFTGPWSFIEPIIKFLREHKGYRSFKWRNPIYQLGLYHAGSFVVTPTFSNAKGRNFSLTVTFTRAYHP
ncbi:MAG: phage tail protein [Serratia proteamaculans]